MISKKINCLYCEYSYFLNVITVTCFLFLSTYSLKSQTYPIQISTQLVPPYSSYLPDYADPMAEKFRVILLFNDFTVPQYNVRLKFEIKGNGFSITTKPLFNPPPLILQPGVPLVLSGLDLAPYLNTSNLDFSGIDVKTYEKRMALPEGHYTFCVTGFDYYSNNAVQVSNQSCSQAWFTLNDPPFLNLPACSTSVAPLNPQNIMFSWMGMNYGSPNSTFNTEYLFELWEIRPSNANAQQIVLSTAPIFKMTTNQTSLVYSMMEPPLNLYMSYAWRVTARDITGRDLFKNQGQSAVCTFSYGTTSEILGSAIGLTLKVEEISKRVAKCTWNSQSAFSSYRLQIKRQGEMEPGIPWSWSTYYPLTNNNNQKANQLEPNKTYEVRVRGESDALIGEWSNTVVFTTLGESDLSCNETTIESDYIKGEPLPKERAIPGLMFQIGQQQVVVKTIKPMGMAGHYRGTGNAGFMYGAIVSVEWDDIYIDENQRAFDVPGFLGVHAVTKGINQWINEWDLKQAEEHPIVIQGSISDLKVNDSSYCVTLKTGENFCKPFPNETNVIVLRDEDGNQYEITIVPKPAKITGKSSYFNISADQLPGASDSLLVTFEASPNQRYGFDAKEYTANIPNYEMIKYGNDQNYFVPYKSISNGQNDEVLANLKVSIKNFKTDKLVFKTSDNKIVRAISVKENQFVISGIPSTSKALYAYYNDKKIGKLNLVSLKPVIRKLILVPVNNTKINLPPDSGLEVAYQQANCIWDVKQESSFSFDLAKDGTEGLEAADANVLSKYSNEMRALRDAYKKANPNYDKDAFYVFVVPHFSDAQLKGYMARGRAVGFVASTSSATEGLRILAHELAHGAFGLEHSFPEIEKGTSNNLLDYTNGLHLTKVQWDLIQNPKAILSWNDSEEDAELREHQAADNVMVFETLKQIKLCHQKGISFPINHLKSSRYNGYRTENASIAGVQYDYIFMYKDLGLNTSKTTINPKNTILLEEKTAYNVGTGKTISYGLITIDGVFNVEVPLNRMKNMEAYLKSLVSGEKNLILFVNGYRNNIAWNLEEFPNSINKINSGDIFNYWDGLDAEFMNRLNIKQAVYADGHHSIETSNHLSQGNFMLSLNSSMNPSEINVVLNRVPNVVGFNFRQANGMIAASELMNKIKSGIIVFNKQTDTLMVVSHSMGFAYAQGMIDVLRKEGVRVTRYYIIAPENGCSGEVDANSFEEICQYGTNENIDPLKKQDGVAPQCPVGNIGIKREYIPKEVKQDFLNSHYISNYHWIFNLSSTRKGYVKPRK